MACPVSCADPPLASNFAVPHEQEKGCLDKSGSKAAGAIPRLFFSFAQRAHKMREHAGSGWRDTICNLWQLENATMQLIPFNWVGSREKDRPGLPQVRQCVSDSKPKSMCSFPRKPESWYVRSASWVSGTVGVGSDGGLLSDSSRDTVFRSHNATKGYKSSRGSRRLDGSPGASSTAPGR